MEVGAKELRQKAGESAVRFVHNGMVLGIGSGRTTGYFIDCLGKKYQQGKIKDILAIPTSEESGYKLRQYGVPITNLSSHSDLDLAVDGADEVDPDLNLIKGLGRALLREKVVEIHARRFLVIVDETKLVARLGATCPLPVEILAFEAMSHVAWLNTLDCRADLWLEEDGTPVVTDNGNYLARLWFDEGIPDPYGLDRALNQRPGILEHGLFLNMATDVLVAGEGGIQFLEHKDGS
jgi:ribose 5-phosphate isomerase A